MAPKNQRVRSLYAYIDGHEDFSVILVNCAAMIGPRLLEHIRNKRDTDGAFRNRSKKFALAMCKGWNHGTAEFKYWTKLSEDRWSDDLYADPRVLLLYLCGGPQDGPKLQKGVPGLVKFAESESGPQRQIYDLRNCLNKANHGQLSQGQRALDAAETLEMLASKLNAKAEQQELARIASVLKLRTEWKPRHKGPKSAPLQDEACVGVHWVEPTDVIPGSWSVVSIPADGKTAKVYHERTTRQVSKILTDLRQGPLRVGLAFCFSCPERELMESWGGNPRDLWEWCTDINPDPATISIDELKLKNNKFRELSYKDKNRMRDPQKDPSAFRETELQAWSDLGPKPASFFDVGGAGSVGALAIKGLPLLKDLYDAGATIWPILSDQRAAKASGITCVEIFPGGLWTSMFPDEPHQSKKSRMRRREFLLDVQSDRALRGITRRNRELFIERERLFDALLTAWALRNYGDNLDQLTPGPGSPELLEGKFWLPTLK